MRTILAERVCHGVIIHRFDLLPKMLIILKNLLNCIFVILILFGYLVTRITQYQTTMYICSLTAITTAAYLAKKHNTPLTGFPGHV